MWLSQILSSFRMAHGQEELHIYTLSNKHYQIALKHTHYQIEHEQGGHCKQVRAPPATAKAAPTNEPN